MPISILPSAFISVSRDPATWYPMGKDPPATTSAAQEPPPTCTSRRIPRAHSHMQHYTLNVSVGLAKGCEFVFEGEGDESPNWEAGNIIIRVLDGKKKGD
ncbi:hypothetical protein JB92DRAFT_3120991 [Gautieria morchelliformis]|nr:hypothetical protein JB92DRAFT_3120991 [Gautieria morchelliformis]